MATGTMDSCFVLIWYFKPNIITLTPNMSENITKLLFTVAYIWFILPVNVELPLEAL